MEGKTYIERQRLHRGWRFLVVLASKKELLMHYDPKTSLVTPKQTAFIRNWAQLLALEERGLVAGFKANLKSVASVLS